MKAEYAGVVAPPVRRALEALTKRLTRVASDVSAVATRATALEAATTTTAWTNVTFQNSWVDYDASTHRPVQYRKVGDVVHLRGMMKDGTIGFVPAFTLPSGFRPAKREFFATASASALGVLALYSDGECHAETGSNTWFSLDNISFSVTA